MTSKRNFYTPKDISKDRDENHSKKIDQIHDEKVRILQDNLVFVNALPSDTSNKETLQSNIYFGRYGPVQKLILNPPYPNKKGFSYQAYVTYGSQLDASLAIVSLDGYNLSNRPLKVSFGTTKYCSHFLKGHDCPNTECFYLHKIDRKRQVSNGQTKIVFKQQNSKALKVVLDNLEEVVNRVLDSDIEDLEEGFPSLTEVLDYLVENQYLPQADLDKAYEECHNKRNFVEPEQPPPLEVRGVSLPDPHQAQKDSQKLNKSNSHSTMCTPLKNSTELQDQQASRALPPPQQLKQKCEQLIHQLRQNIVDKQNSLGVRELQVQQKIEKLIIKQILRKGNECRSRFIKNATATRQEVSKIRGIVQKYLIAQN